MSGYMFASSVSSSLVKMLYWMCEMSGRPPTGPQLKHVICRNFGGMESDELDTLEEFKKQIHISDQPDLQSIPQRVYMHDLKAGIHDVIYLLCIILTAMLLER